MPCLRLWECFVTVISTARILGEFRRLGWGIVECDSAGRAMFAVIRLAQVLATVGARCNFRQPARPPFRFHRIDEMLNKFFHDNSFLPRV